MINLEQILFQELKLAQILEMVSKDVISCQDLQTLCEEWWEVSIDAGTLFETYKLFKNTVTSENFRFIMIYESLIVILIARLSITKNIDYSLQQYLIELIESTHQNFFHLIMMLLSKMGDQAMVNNVWASALKEQVNAKCSEKFINMNEHQRNQEIIEKL